MSCAHVAVRKNILAIFLFVPSMFLFAPWSMALDGALCSLMRISNDGVERLGASEETICFGVDLPSAGVFAITATAPLPTDTEPLLQYLGGTSCHQASPVRGGAVFLERRAGSLVLEVADAGTYGFCMVSQKPQESLDGMRVVRRFAAMVAEPADEHKKDDDPDEAEPDPNPVDGCGTDANNDDPDEAEPDPNPFCSCGTEADKNDDPDEAEPDPNPFCSCGTEAEKDDDPDEAEPDPNPFGGESGLCEPRAWSDDHADLMTCASRLGTLTTDHPARSLQGETWHQDGRDVDNYVFAVEELVRLEVAVNGEAERLVVLTDAAGHRLAFSEPGGIRQPSRLSKVLPRGRYFLQVSAPGGEQGEYSLWLDAVAVDHQGFSAR